MTVGVDATLEAARVAGFGEQLLGPFGIVGGIFQSAL